MKGALEVGELVGIHPPARPKHVVPKRPVGQQVCRTLVALRPTSSAALADMTK